MQSIEAGSNNKLECADCKSQFTSASLLLKHFADHIHEVEIENVFKNATELSNCKNSALSLLQAKKKIQKESILETVLRLSSIQCKVNGNVPSSNFLSDVVCNSSTSSTDSFKSFACHPGNVITCDNGTNTALPSSMVMEIGQRAKEKLKVCNDTSIVKFDLQKRLERCVSKLQALRNSKETIEISNTAHDVLAKSEVDDILNCKIAKHENYKKNDGEDFSPLKFCAVTLQESEEGLIFNTNVLKDEQRNSKGASNRKQLMPKKIHRPQVDSKKIVPKPDELAFSGTKTCQRAPGKRKYLCHVCSKSFGWSTDLKRHILTHTGERPFKCQMCEATFTRNFLLQKHESRVHSLSNVDTKFTQEQDKELISSQSSNSCLNIELNVDTVEKEKNISTEIKDQKKRLKTRRAPNGLVKNSCNTNTDKMQTICGKFSPPKRKLCAENSSFNSFPQKFFNIL